LAGLSADTDLFHVNELFGFSAAFARKDRGLVISSHNSYLDRMRAARGLRKLRYPPLVALERLTYPKADRVIIGSEIERAPVRQLGVHEARIVEIPYGVDLERFTDPERVRGNSVRDRLGIPRDAEVGLFVGRFVERKKPHVAAQAFAELAQERPQFHAIFVGDGTLLPAIRAASTGAAKLHFLGAVPFSELAPFYAAADVFALPSVGEGSISLAVLEAAAAGLPLVLTLDSAGQSRVFEPNQNGEIVRLDDAADLVRGLRQALQKRHAYAKRSRELVVEHFSWDACAKATIRCYEDALRTRSR
jgi:glycosyltransferase involved in cell wall biosynthesis